MLSLSSRVLYEFVGIGGFCERIVHTYHGLCRVDVEKVPTGLYTVP